MGRITFPQDASPVIMNDRLPMLNFNLHRAMIRTPIHLYILRSFTTEHFQSFRGAINCNDDTLAALSCCLRH